MTPPTTPPTTPENQCESQRLDRPLVCIGAGAMASAIILGGIDAGRLQPAKITITDHSPSKLDEFAARGCVRAPDAAAALASAQSNAAVLLAIKPQGLRALAGGIGQFVGSRLVISVLAGVSTGQLRSAFGGHCSVIRAMPNTPARIGRGVTGLVAGDRATRDDLALARTIFAAVGSVHELSDEALMPIFTLLAASGPAYVFYLAEALERGAASLGMSAGDARSITSAMIEGSAMLLAQSDDQSPAALRASVTSKGGVTAAATDALDAAGVMEAFASALRAGVAHDAVLAKAAE